MKGLTARWTFRTPLSNGVARSCPDGAPLVARVLAARGITEPDTAARFLDPRLSHLHDPSLIPDLDKGAARLLDAARAGEQIVIYGDYDVDGVTATAILFHTLRAIAPGADVRTYVPHRIDEGYGLNEGAIRDLAAAGARVIVSVDCGVTAVGPADVANRLGVDLIITDHHNPPASITDLPSAFAVVHPRRPDSEYSFGELSGAGVAYKLAWRLFTMHCGSQKIEPRFRELLVELLAFAGLGTIADIVPLVDENRILARFGLVRIRHSPFIGLRALVEASGLASEQIGELEVGFRLGPRLNAAGRMGHAREAVELFTTADEPRAREIAAHLSRQNDARRKVETEIFEQALRMAEEAGMDGDGRRAVVLAHESWHTGVVGIVCSRVVERLHRPTILMQVRDGVCHGSGRSIDGFNLHAGLVACSSHLTQFGGHNMAAGLHLAEPKLPHFIDAFTAHANSAIGRELLCASITIDCEASPFELSIDSIRDLQSLAPFGAGNARVRTLLRNVRIAAQPRLMGAAGKHLDLRVTAEDAGGNLRQLRLVGWDWGRHAARLAPGVILDAVVTPKVSEWNGSVSVEAEIADLAVVGG